MTLFHKLVEPGSLPPHKRELKINAPINGRVKPLDEFPSKLLTERLFGEGVCVDPSGYQVTAPFDGVVELLPSTCEQIRIKSNKGIKLRIQLGYKAENMMAEGFKIKVPEGHSFKQGEVLLEYDLRKMKEQLSCVLFPVTILNSEKMRGVVPNYRQVIASEDHVFSLLI